MTSGTIQIPAVLLAAGLSSRMGMFKPLLPLGGVPLILHVVEALRKSDRVGPIIVVTGHRGAEVEAVLPADVVRVENPDYATGEMLSSLKAGLRQVEMHMPAVPGFLLAFANQPAVLSHTVTRLADAFLASRPPLALPVHAGK